MWILVLFDLPTQPKATQIHTSHFKRTLLKQGFLMRQYSVYVKHCLTLVEVDKYTKRSINHIPPKGKVHILTLQDRQYNNILGFEQGQPSNLHLPKPEEIFMLF